MPSPPEREEEKKTWTERERFPNSRWNNVECENILFLLKVQSLPGLAPGMEGRAVLSLRTYFFLKMPSPPISRNSPSRRWDNLWWTVLSVRTYCS